VSCIFCKIIRGDIPAAKVLETDAAVAFLDIQPVIPGHVLLVPKAHHANLAELPEELAAATAALLPKLCGAIRAATGADGFNVVINNGRAAGQVVEHGHWHIIPRFHDDPVNWPWPHGEYVGDELGQMRFRIERELSPPDED
jgi:histidine triad (HIT) family protein